jgi:hypothetical protein
MGKVRLLLHAAQPTTSHAGAGCRTRVCDDLLEERARRQTEGSGGLNVAQEPGLLGDLD